MRQIHVVVCMGTTCSVMGGSHLGLLADHLPERLRAVVQVEGCGCLGYCEDRRFGRAPYVEIDGEVMCEATVPKVIEHLSERAAALA